MAYKPMTVNQMLNLADRFGGFEHGVVAALLYCAILDCEYEMIEYNGKEVGSDWKDLFNSDIGLPEWCSEKYLEKIMYEFKKDGVLELKHDVKGNLLYKFKKFYNLDADFLDIYDESVFKEEL